MELPYFKWKTDPKNHQNITVFYFYKIMKNGPIEKAYYSYTIHIRKYTMGGTIRSIKNPWGGSYSISTFKKFKLMTYFPSWARPELIKNLFE